MRTSKKNHSYNLANVPRFSTKHFGGVSNPNTEREKQPPLPLRKTTR